MIEKKTSVFRGKNGDTLQLSEYSLKCSCPLEGNVQILIWNHRHLRVKTVSRHHHCRDTVPKAISSCHPWMVVNHPDTSGCIIHGTVLIPDKGKYFSVFLSFSFFFLPSTFPQKGFQWDFFTRSAVISGRIFFYVDVSQWFFCSIFSANCETVFCVCHLTSRWEKSVWTLFLFVVSLNFWYLNMELNYHID